MHALAPAKPHARPRLNLSLAADEFSAWYWLKEDLVQFCRNHRIPAAGLKRDLEARIAAYLSGNALVTPVPTRRSPATMPDTFHPEMRIGIGWRCGPALGAYFRQRLGNGFHFHAAMRDFIHNGAGRMLLEAESYYLENRLLKNAPKPISEQLDYNRHFREYFAVHPGATKQEAIEAWWVRRRKRRVTG